MMEIQRQISNYEQITNLAPTKAVKKSDEFLAEGWGRREYEVLDLKKPIPWALTDPALRSWNFYLHSLDMIDALLAAHSQTGEETYLSPALRIGLDWVRQHPRDAEGVSPMAWYDMAVGLRAYRLGYLYQAAEAAGLLEAGAKAALWTSLDEHRAELADDANIAFHNNHGYFQVAGQLALGRRFKEGSAPMSALYTQGVHRLRRMLDQQFGPDGVHREHSPDYHRMVADTLLGLVRAGLVEDPELLARVDGIENALAWFVTPEGTITNFGDSDSRKMIYSAEGASRKWTTPLMRAVASNGAAGSGWPKGLKVFDESGYAIVRLPDPRASDEITRDSYLAQTAAFHSRTHKHCDDLSFIWHDRGQPLLIDAGRYGYIGKTETGSDLWQEGFWYSDPMRMFMESTRAHNTLEFDGLDARRKGVKPYGSALVQACERSGVYCIETRCKQHRSIWHDRLLLLKPGQWLVVFDVYTDNLREPHDVRQWFHLTPRHKAHPVDGGYDVALRDGSALSIRSLIGTPEVVDVISGRTEDPIQGWWSENERTVEPADALAFRQTGNPKGVFATLLTLSAKVRADLTVGRSNVTGRKAQLGWKDAFGQHRVEFQRDDQFTLTYTSAQPQAGSDKFPVDPAVLDTLDTLMVGARVILEYGIGPAARRAVSRGNSLVICVHDDREELREMRLLCRKRPEALILHHVDRGQGKAASIEAFAGAIWDQPWFRTPDIVSIGGTDAPACLTQVQKRISRRTAIIWRNFVQHPNQEIWVNNLKTSERVGPHLVFYLVPAPQGHKS